MLLNEQKIKMNKNKAFPLYFAQDKSQHSATRFLNSKVK